MAYPHHTNPPTDFATPALFDDIWAGPVQVRIVPFRTKRRGETVTRYRWQRADRHGMGYGTFVSPEQAIAAARRDQRFTLAA